VARKKRRKPHGTGTVYARGPGNWWIKWRENGVVRYSHGYESRELAERVLAKIVADLAAGRAGLPVEKKVPGLAELARSWLERRERTHRSAKEDFYRWARHLAKWFGHLQPGQVDTALLRRFIEAKLAEGLSSSTVRLCVAEVSSLMSDLVEQGYAPANPVRLLPRSTRRLIRPAKDPRTTPFIERLEDIRRIYDALAEPVNVAYAIGALAGLRTGEVLALRWPHVDLATRRIHVRESVGGPLKDDESRVVLIQDALLAVLTPWRAKSGGEGPVVLPMRADGRRLDEHTVGRYLREALRRLKLPRITWYQATRHTFASQWVLGGGSIEKLRVMMGHSTVQVTERYAHLRLDLFTDSDLRTMKVNLGPTADHS
jgi:integrase